MAQKAIREHLGKALIFSYLHRFLKGFDQKFQAVVIKADNIDKIKFPKWKSGYVAKPDQLFGKRGKNRLIFKDKNPEKVRDWIKRKMRGTVKVFRSKADKGIAGQLDTFIVEPFIEHSNEYYLAFKTARNYDAMYFSTEGGIEIEENWGNVVEVGIQFRADPKPLTRAQMREISKKLDKDESKTKILDFISAMYQLFRYLDFTYLEVNPFTVVNGQIYLLDLVARLDDMAIYRNYYLWSKAGEIEFPVAFGSSQSHAETEVAVLDSSSGASLKLTILNPNGRIWMLTSGGGGSVIFADTVGDLGFSKDLANYGEYSGNPSTDETEAYTRIVLREMLQSKAENKVLIIGGGIANFTDVKRTFTGVLNAIKHYQKQVRSQKVKLYVRRGGPSYKEGLKLIKEEVQKMEIPIEVHGPETFMTEIIRIALNN